MKINHNSIYILVVVSLTLTSCVTNKKLTYLQYENDRNNYLVIEPSTYILQPYDNLFIRVITPDPLLSNMFNTMPLTASGISTGEQSADLISYPIDGEGTIRLPYIGRIKVAGKTLATITTEVETALKEYVTDAAINVRMVNNNVSLIGEVQRPGKYPIYKERMNIFQALAMAGDLGVYSDRQRIQLIRQTPEGNVIKEFSVKDRSIIGSEFFYVMPNDVIYAKPMKGRFFQLNAFPYTVILSTITTFVLLWNVLR